MNNERTCNTCGWVHMGVSVEQINKDVYEFEEMFSELSAAERNRHYNNQLPNFEEYLHCKKCGGSYENFRESKEDDCPDGSTIPAILMVNV